MTDQIRGTISFLDVRVGIIEGEIGIVRKEEYHNHDPAMNISSADQKTLYSKQILTGLVYKGESMPFTVDLAVLADQLTPTMEDLHRTVSINYYFNVLLRDKEGRRYYKQAEIRLLGKDSKYDLPFPIPKIKVTA